MQPLHTLVIPQPAKRAMRQQTTGCRLNSGTFPFNLPVMIISRIGKSYRAKPLVGGVLTTLCLWLAALSNHSKPCFAASEPDVRRDAAVIATERVLPSVVNIATETVIEYHDWYDELLRQFYGARTPVRQQKSLSLGSGVVIDEDGYILTNFHVVRRATRIQVKLWDGREFDADQIVATTASDVALLRIRCKP